jgi:tetraprenyl-beta-curcumene synthase
MSSAGPAPPSLRSAGLALALANARYWTSVAPLVRAQLVRWELRAGAIGDPALRALALEKLRAERFNAEVAATLATLAPRAQRARTVEAIVALEVAYDYLDGLTEQPATDPLRNGRRLSMAFTDALGTAPGREHGGASGGEPAQTGNYFREHPSDDGGYLAELSETTRAALTSLPAWSAVSEAARASAARCAEAQVRVHAAPATGGARLEEWAQAQAASTDLGWREYIAGAVSSVLGVHALIAAAADARTTPTQAVAIDGAYMSIAALSTMLDGTVDYEHDSVSGEAWYVGLYDSRAALTDSVIATIRDAKARVRRLPRAAHHTIMLAGVAAYYTSAPQATRGLAAPLARRVNDELGPMMAPTLAVMRVWRAAKRLRRAAGGKRRTALPAGASVDEEATPRSRGLNTTAGPT